MTFGLAENVETFGIGVQSIPAYRKECWDAHRKRYDIILSIENVSWGFHDNGVTKERAEPHIVLTYDADSDHVSLVHPPSSHLQ